MARILIVDDEPGYLRLLERILTADGHRVTIATTSEAALKSADACSPEVLLADWKLKEQCSGLDLARTLSAVNPQLSTIIMTGYSSRTLYGETQGTPKVFILEKPFGVDTVLSLVHRVMLDEG